METAFFYQSTSLDPYYNLAVESVLSENVLTDWGGLYLWRNEKTVVIGRHQNPYLECNLENLQQDSIHLARRMTGGGAVYHDAANLNFTFFNRRSDFDIKRNFNVILRALRQLEIEAQPDGRNDLCIQGKKFSGNAFFKNADIAYHHGTLMLGVSLSNISKYLTPSVFKLKSKGVASVKSRVINLNKVKEFLTIEMLSEALKQAYVEEFQINLKVLKNIAVDSLKRRIEKFSSSLWIMGENPDFLYKSSAHFIWGDVMIGLDFKGKIHIYSDALDTELISFVNKRLENEVNRLTNKVLTLSSTASFLDNPPQELDNSQQQMWKDIQNLISEIEAP